MAREGRRRETERTLGRGRRTGRVAQREGESGRLFKGRNNGFVRINHAEKKRTRRDRILCEAAKDRSTLTKFANESPLGLTVLSRELTGRNERKKERKISWGRHYRCSSS